MQTKSVLNLSVKCVLWCFFLLIAGASYSQAPVTFNYTGSVQTYTVPPCVTQLNIVAAGGKGGGFNGANGATVSGVLNVTPGQVLQIYVGGQGSCPAAGWNGGGSGGFASGSYSGCGGGGASDVRIAPYTLNNRVIVAGAGGGTGGGNENVGGGSGGCAIGAAGLSSFGSGATGGSQFSGGMGGAPWISSGNYGGSGSLGNGGNGANDPCYNVAPGGGGGGGYYGGGGGGSDCFASTPFGGGGGSGGSSLTPAGGSCVQGNNTGNGYVTITPNFTGLDLTITPTSATICVGESVTITANGAVNYTWSPAEGLNTTNGPTVIASPTATQTYTVLADDGGNCSDEISVTITVLPEPVVSVTPDAPEICEGESVMLTASGATSYVWSPATGLSNTTGASVTATLSADQTYTVTGTTGNCTAETTVSVSILDPVELNFTPENPELCPGGSTNITVSGADNYTWTPATGLNTTTGPTVVASPTATTTYTVTGTAVGACPGIIEVTATILPVPEVDAGNDLEICADGSINLNGSSNDAVSYSWTPIASLSDPLIANPVASPLTTTTYTLEVTDVNGCTNTDNMTVNVIDDSYEINVDVSLCDGENHTLPDGTTVSETGIYNNLFTTALGCDSLVITNVVVHPLYNLDQTAELCEGETFTLPDGVSVTTSGNYTANLLSAAGCDSIINYSVTFNPVFEAFFEPIICESQTHVMPDGTTATTAGTYTFNFTTVEGCDSIIHVDLTVLETEIIPQDITTCDNESHTLPDGTVVNAPGYYEVVISSGSTCDQLYQITINHLPTYNTAVDIAICQGESYTLPNGTSINSGGTYPLTLSSVDGCDSIVNFNLSILPVYNTSQTVNICSGETYTLPDGTDTGTAGTYPVTFNSVSGCDSTVTTNVIVRPVYDHHFVWNVCSGNNPLDPFGNPVTSDLSFELEYTSVFGCDSIVQIDIFLHDSYSDTTEVTICQGEKYVTSGGQIITTPGWHSDIFTNSGGCDSLKIYQVTVNPAPLPYFTPSIRNAGIYDGPVQFFNESTFTDSISWDFGVHGIRLEDQPIIDFDTNAGVYPICLTAWNDYGCTAQYCLNYEVLELFTVYIPSAFSPNGDGLNDLFWVQGMDIDPDRFRLQIFNRYGEVIFEATNPEDKWDGSTPGNTHYVEDEVYVYRVEVSSLSMTDSRVITGKVVTVR